eukprot:3326371-Rhodomonas_salina.1
MPAAQERTAPFVCTDQPQPDKVTVCNCSQTKSQFATAARQSHCLQLQPDKVTVCNCSQTKSQFADKCASLPPNILRVRAQVVRELSCLLYTSPSPRDRG